MSKVSEGDIAPDFTLPTDGDGSFTLSEKRGSPVILFFYPKDNTPGCTKEAIGFSEHLDAFKKLGCLVVGMSPDPVKNHDKFVAKHELTTTLISDEEKTTLARHGTRLKYPAMLKRFLQLPKKCLASTCLCPPSPTV